MKIRRLVASALVGGALTMLAPTTASAKPPTCPGKNTVEVGDPVDACADLRRS